MRVEHKTIEWFTIDELKQADDIAYRRALEIVDNMLWEGQHHHESIGQTLVMALAMAIGEPSAEQHGEADYSGIPGVEFQGWDLERAQSLTLSGTLTPDNAPKLPWAQYPMCGEVGLEPYRSGTGINPEWSDEAYEMTADDRLTTEHCNAMADAVSSAIGDAVVAGNREVEYVSSEEYLLEMAQANGYEFTVDGWMR